MINVLYTDPRSWGIDFSSNSWHPEEYGVRFELHPDIFNIQKTGIQKKYSAVVTSEVWEIPMQKSLEYVRGKGKKIFLLPREPFKTDALKDTFFNNPRFLHNGSNYFSPDILLAPNKKYSDYWSGKTKIVITGHPRFDYLLGQGCNRKKILSKYKLQNKKIVFFPSYPPYHAKKGGGLHDIWQGREDTLQALEAFAKSNPEFQVVVKIHPASFKCFKKGVGNKKEVSGTLLKYYHAPTDYMKVIGDDRMSGNIARDLLSLADVVVGFSSTMLLEAIHLNKPVVHILMGNTIEVGFNDFKTFIPTAYNKEELCSYIKSAKEVDKGNIEPFLHKIDGQCCRRICEAIKENV